VSSIARNESSSGELIVRIIRKIEFAVAVLALVPASLTFADPAPDRRYEPGEIFRDYAECPEMVVVPAGSFTMGSPKSERYRIHVEGPQL
jgi:formylglycine-generating enzyme required for sulfatase activity